MAETGELSRAAVGALELVEQLTGIVVPTWRWPVVEAELEWLGDGDGPEAGLDRVASDQDGARARLAAALSIPETYVFRHPRHFEMLRSIAARLAADGRACRVLSAGCSTGEEAWSAAAVLSSVPAPAGQHHRVVGWELDADRVRHALIGRYGSWSGRAGFMGYEALFHPEGDGFVVADSLREMVSFRQVNLVAGDLPPDGPFDVVFFRNVTIYWREETTAGVCDRLAELVRRGGVFMVGPSDPIFLPREAWVQRLGRGARCFLRSSHGSSTCATGEDPVRVGPATTPAEPEVAPPRAARLGALDGQVRTGARPVHAIPTSPRTHDTDATRVVGSSPERSIDVLLEQVRRLADTGQYHAALDAVERHDGCATVSGRLWKGILHLNLGDGDQAVRLFRQCVFLRPDDADLRRWLAVAYEAIGQIKEAEREHRNAAELGS